MFPGKMLNLICWAPANLRYGDKITNAYIGQKNAMDPMGDEYGYLTKREVYFNSLGNKLKWPQQDNCEAEFVDEEPKLVPCRPSSTGWFQVDPRDDVLDSYHDYIYDL
jgi:hypothetical protein